MPKDMGSPLSPNTDFTEEYLLIPLTRGKFAKVSPQDYGHLMQWKWCSLQSGRQFYAVRISAKKQVRMHRLVVGVDDANPLTVDHINHDTLDNRRCNLRIATQAQQTWNRIYCGTNGMKGTYFEKHKRRWRAAIRVNGKITLIGRYKTQEEAHLAYKEASTRLFGEFACHG